MITIIELITYFTTLLFYILTLILSFRLWLLIRNEKYWIGLPLATLSFAIHEFLEIITIFTEMEFGIFPELFELAGAFFLIYLTLGLSSIITNVSGYLKDKDDFE